MSAIIGIGATHELEGFALAGVRIIPAATDEEAILAWSGLGDDVGLVLLSCAAADSLGSLIAARDEILTAVMS